MVAGHRILGIGAGFAVLAVLLVLALVALLLGPGAALSQSAPTVSGVAVTSNAGDDDTYLLGETIRITVTFNETVDVTGSPQLAIDMDPAEWGTKWASYASGSGTDSLTFTYTVVEPNISTQGIAVLANTLELNGGTIKSASSQTDADLSHVGLAHAANHKVDWRLPQASVTDVSITSDAGDDDTYAQDDVISITLTFDETVNVTGTPRLKIDMDPAGWGTKWAGYASGSGTASLTFTYTVVEPNLSTQGIAVLADTLQLNGGSIKSASSQTDADLSHVGLAHAASHKVDWRRSQPAAIPTVTGVMVSSDAVADDTYGLGDVIRITLTFSETVNVTGSPQLVIDMDPAAWGDKPARYRSGNGTANLTFGHVVVEPNISTQGIAVLANTLQLNGGSIKSASSQADADLSHTGLAHDANHKVDWRREPGQPNRAPVVNAGTWNYQQFIGNNNAPRGILVSKSFYQVFSDPEGDELTYSVSIPDRYRQLLNEFSIGLDYRTPENSHRPLEAFHRVWFRAEDDQAWEAITPPLADPLIVTATVTATDPDGLSVSLDGDFLIDWEIHPVRESRQVCERTPAVRDAIMGMIPDVSDCADVTNAHLAAITGDLHLGGQGISTLQAGDFDGLSSLNAVDLQNNRLISLPADIFQGLSMARWVRLHDNRLLTLDEDTFSGMDNLRAVELGTNNLKTIPSGLFKENTKLHTISLNNNELATVPVGAFSGLVNLHTLRLHDNRIITLPAGLFHDLAALTTLRLDDAVNPQVCNRSDKEVSDLLSLLPNNDITCRQVTDGDIADAKPNAGVCSRTPAVRTAIVSKASGVHDCAAVTNERLATIAGNMDLSQRGLTTLRAGDFAGLRNLEGLSLRYNRLTGLPEGAFDDLSALAWLKIDNNQLTVLPSGIFSELDNLSTLWLNNNRLSTAPAELFDGLDTLDTLHMYSNDFTTLPAGLFADLTTIPMLWLDHAVTPRLCSLPEEERGVILERLPDISDCRLVTDGDISLATAAIPSLPVCDRTPQVRDGILRMISGVSNCADVTEQHLAAITGDLLIGRQGITILKAGDFDGLSNLNGLVLQHGQLTTLPRGVFDDLTNLRWLRLNDNALTELPPDIFSNLTRLERLYLGSNSLITVPASLLANNSSLHTLTLDNNDLTRLPGGLFDGLTALATLYLNENDLTTLPAGLFADLTGIETLRRDDAVNPRLCERPQEEQDAILDSFPDISDCRLVTDSDVDSLSLPNIILIMADDLGYGDLGSYGQETIKTPRLDAMATAGMRFTDFYAGHTVCPPSREALLTGRHTGHTALRGGSWTTDDRICDSRTTIAQMLQSAGYRTAVIGKWGVGGESTPGQPNDKGFDYFYGFLEHRHAHNAYPDMLVRNKDQVKLANVLQRERTFWYGGFAKDKGKVEFAQDLLMEDALRFIEEASDASQPFFLYLPLTPPHANTGPQDSGMEAPPDGYGQYAEESWNHVHKSYAAMVSYLDKDIGRLLDKLVELGVANDTVTFVTSDNGPHDEGGVSRTHFNSAGPLSGGKRSLKEGGIRVPLIVHWPGSIAAGSVSDHVSASWDFMPTLAQIAGAPTPEGSDGVSMLPTLKGDDGQAVHDYLYWNFHWWDWSRRQQADVRAARWGNWKAIWGNFLDMQLYDLSNDLGETRNVAGANPDVVRKMREIETEAHVDKSLVRAGFCYIE